MTLRSIAAAMAAACLLMGWLVVAGQEQQAALAACQINHSIDSCYYEVAR